MVWWSLLFRLTPYDPWHYALLALKLHCRKCACACFYREVAQVVTRTGKGQGKVREFCFLEMLGTLSWCGYIKSNMLIQSNACWDVSITCSSQTNTDTCCFPRVHCMHTFYITLFSPVVKLLRRLPYKMSLCVAKLRVSIRLKSAEWNN